MIIFPELTLSGYPAEDLLFRKEYHDKIMLNLQDIQDTTKDCYVIVGHPMIHIGGCYNGFSIFYQGEKIRAYHKQKLPNYGVFDEARYFTPGKKILAFYQLKTIN